MRGRLIRQPLLHFAVLGGLLFAIDRWQAPDQPDADPIVIDAVLAQRLSQDWQRNTGRTPDAAELDALLHQHLQDQRLLREALRVGVAERDGVVRTRLVDNLRFVDPDTPQSDAALFRQALAMGMAERDPVARRRLIQRMGQELTGDIVVDPVALSAHIEAHPERYAPPKRYRIDHVFLTHDASPERRAAMTAALETGTDGQPLGDPFLLSGLPEWATETELRRLLGPTLTDHALSAAPGVWSAPLSSPWGWHFVRVDAQNAPEAVVSPGLWQQAAYAWLMEREAELLQQALHRLAQRYPADWQIERPGSAS